MKRDTRLQKSNGPGLTPAVDRSTTWRHGSEHAYRRHANPTVLAAEALLGELEGGTALLYSSGMGAVSGVLFPLLAPGDAVAFPRDAYYGVAAFLREDFARWGVSLLEFDQREAPPEGARIVWLETPSNPLLTVPDIRSSADAAHAAGAIVVVDATAASPVLLRPLEHGADVVVHSATKFLGGHSDVLAGALVAQDPGLVGELAGFRTRSGLVSTPDEAWLLQRGMRTLPLRVERQSETALELARRLAAHPAVETVRYPGLGNEIAARYMEGGFGGLLSFDLRGGGAAARKVEEAVRVIANATSLGGVESTLESRHRWEGDRVPEGLVRISAGLEDVGDLWADLEQALAQA
jgi:cystathionine gamma-synthase